MDGNFLGCTGACPGRPQWDSLPLRPTGGGPGADMAPGRPTGQGVIRVRISCATSSGRTPRHRVVLVGAPLTASVAGAIIRNSFENEARWSRAAVRGLGAGLVSVLLCFASQLLSVPTLLDDLDVRSLLFFTIPLGFSAALAFDLVSGEFRCCAPCSSPRSSVWVFPQFRALIAVLGSAIGRHEAGRCPGLIDLYPGWRPPAPRSVPQEWCVLARLTVWPVWKLCQLAPAGASTRGQRGK